ADPLGGSFYVEALTRDIEARILDEVDEIERLGGYVKAIEDGEIYSKVASYFTEQQRLIERGEIALVGQNVYRSGAEGPAIDVFRYPEGVEEEQKARLQQLRLTRDSGKVRSALSALRDACLKGYNILPYSVACARARCTEGELFKVFKDAFGLWKPPALF
ncbi:MAG: methylmalonyl-CoA mutase, N-terminal domain, partial [Thermodesulfobacteriota bacterium]|nr:methylmalonyl-CoA mutase, N-terminal domain [Thermodesulfobacteriota bacterium]